MSFASVAEIEGSMVMVEGKLGPTGFFENLRSVDLKGRTVVMNNAGEVQEFPERITVTLFIFGPIPKEHEKLRSFSLDAEYMGELKFKADWKRGVELRPVKSLRVLSVSETQLPDFGNFIVPRNGWIYEFVIEDSEVPVNDHLVLYINSPRNERIVRMSAHL
jgi:hypothetical protein